DSGLIFRRGTPPDVSYVFKHALVQDAAYGTLLKSRRQQLHASIARALEMRFPDYVQIHPEIVARHFTDAGLSRQAIGYWLEAGQLASNRSAIKEAVTYLRKGLDLLRELEPGPQREQLELQSTIGPALVATKGSSAPETVAAYERAHELMHATNEFSASGA